MKLPPNPLIYEILEAAGKARSKAEKIEILKKRKISFNCTIMKINIEKKSLT